MSVEYDVDKLKESVAQLRAQVETAKNATWVQKKEISDLISSGVEAVLWRLFLVGVGVLGFGLYQVAHTQ